MRLTDGYQELTTPRRWALASILGLVVLIVGFGICLVQVSALLERYAGVVDVATYEAFLGEMEPWSQRLDAIVIGFYICGAAFLISLLTWVYNASWNAGLFDPDQTRIVPKWSVFWFLIPIANLTRPYSVMREIHNSSLDPVKPLNQPLPYIYSAWWGMWLIALCANVVMSLMMTDQAYLSNISAFLSLEIGGGIAAVISLVLLGRIMATISRMQEAKRHTLPEEADIAKPEPGNNSAA